MFVIVIQLKDRLEGKSNVDVEARQLPSCCVLPPAELVVALLSR